MTWKQLPGLALGKDFWEMNAGVSIGYSNCWRLQRRAAGEAANMMENALSIVIVIFSAQHQQTETSDRKLFIFQHGHHTNVSFQDAMLAAASQALNFIRSYIIY